MTRFCKNTPKFVSICKSCSQKYPVKFLEKYWQKGTASNMILTLCWPLFPLCKIVGEIDSSPSSINVCNKRECLPLAGLACLVYCLQIRLEPTWVKHLSDAPLLVRLLAILAKALRVALQHKMLPFLMLMPLSVYLYQWPIL